MPAHVPASLHRDKRLDSVHAFRLAALGVQIGAIKSGAYRIHPDPLFGHFPGQAHGKRLDRALAGRIVDGLAR